MKYSNKLRQKLQKRYKQILQQAITTDVYSST